MSNDFSNHPLNGLSLDDVLGELLRHYGWEILAEQININCFKVNPSFESSIKYLRKTAWAREKLEAFYMYKFKQLPKPSDEEHQLAPRNRPISASNTSHPPAKISPGDAPFFDDPESGPVFPSRQALQRTRHQSKSSARAPREMPENKPDPWANWKKKNK